MMSTPGIFSSTFLPHSGEPVDFLLEDREDPIHGTFDEGAFHSRWASYDPTRVRSWRLALIDPSHEMIVPPRVSAGRKVFAALENAALRLMGKGHPAANVGHHARHVAPSARCLVGAAAPALGETHGNRISSWMEDRTGFRPAG